MKKIVIIVAVVAAIVLVAYHGKSFFVTKTPEIPALDSSYLQTRVDGDLYVTKGRKLERLYVSSGSITREEVEVAPPVPEDGFYVFLDSYGPRLVTAYHISPVIKVFHSDHVNGPESIFKISLDAGVCSGGSSIEDIIIKDGQLLYFFITSERHSPRFYFAIDLTKEDIVERQIEEEEWKQLAGKTATD